MTTKYDPELAESITVFAQKKMREMAEQLVSVQPMDSNLMKDIFKHGKSEAELIEAGYSPVSNHNLLWMK